MSLNPMNVTTTEDLDGIAIIGMVGKFPGADHIDQLWQNLCDGVESIAHFVDEDLDPSIDPQLSKYPNYVKARGIMAGAEDLDAAFFEINPREAEVIDPQARVLLELVFSALEQAGCNPDKFAGSIGLYAGCSQNTYYLNHLHGRQDILDRIGELQMMFASEKDYLTTRVSYKLDLKGPSVSVSTSCSSSLVAVAQAFQALSSYQCDLAVAGAVSIAAPQHSGYLEQEGSIFAPDGHCRPFDAQAQGTVFGNGGGLVVLKRLDEALAAGDRIYAVIRGIGVNNDGADKVSFSAPSVDGQAQAIAAAQAYADFHPETISYIEAHGTGTLMGDPIEVAALTQAFRLQTAAKQFCAIGSIKANIGHLADAAGVVGLIKIALALDHQQLPPSINFTTPNPKLDLDHSPFYVNTKLVDWPKGATPRRAGLSSFGVGGTNVHLVIEEAPPQAPSGKSRRHQLLLLSAKTRTALASARQNLQTHFATNPQINLADAAYTLRQGRKEFNHRSFLVVQDPADAVLALAEDSRRAISRQMQVRTPAVVFMFPGQGSQYVNMGINFYHDEPVYREVVDRCAEILQPLMGLDIRSIIYPAAADPETAAISLAQTCFTQPALFVTEYALAQLWQSWGVTPQATIGHSIGEFVSACLGGVFSLEDALQLVATRSQMMWDLPRGSMLSVRLSATDIIPYLTEDLAIAAINSPTLCVIAGSIVAIERLQSQLIAKEIACRLLHAAHAFHSSMMDEMIEPFTAIVNQVKLSPPQIPFISTVTGDWITDAQATDPLYWATQIRQTVQFATGIITIWQQPDRLLLEIGPRTTTATLARQQAQDIYQQIAISSLHDAPENEWQSLLQAVGQLWLAGVSINWDSFEQAETRRKVPLPTYPFERQRFWIDPLPPQHADRTQPVNSHPPLTSTVQSPNLLPMLKPPLTTPVAPNRSLIAVLKEVFGAISGLDMINVAESTTFLEMGLDSLSLTQVGIALKKKFQVKVTLRQLLELYPTFGTLADFLITIAPAAVLPTIDPVVAEPSTESPLVANSVPNSYPTPVAPINVIQALSPLVTTNNLAPQLSRSSLLETVIGQQLQLMNQQLALLGHNHANPQLPVVNSNGDSPQNGRVQPATVITVAVPTAIPTVMPTSTVAAELCRSRIELLNAAKNQNKTLTDGQRSHLAKIIDRYTQRTPKSKEFAATHRAYLADPLTVSGFNPMLKEMAYPIVVDRSSGSKLWDIDGNEYVDLVSGLGLNLLGWSPAFVTEAITNQLQLGLEIGPQSPLVGEVAKLICEMTGLDRAAFCNTGSEALLGAMRIAQTVTGRDLVAIFAGSCHGSLDEVVVTGSKQRRSILAALGIPAEIVANILVIDYDAPDAMEILKSRAGELAAVIVEPVQSQSPEYQPRALLHQLREFTYQSGIALIFDEIVTGFRIDPGGAQAHFGVKADIATYGKIVGGGLSIGVIAGTAKYMDALDGGQWQFGDDSIPKVGGTDFAETFVRHPLALAAAKAVLTHLKQSGASLQQQLNAKTDRFVTELTTCFQQVGAPFTVHNFGSLLMVKYPPNFLAGDLLFYLMRSKGIYIYDRRPCFLTTAHTDSDLAVVITTLTECIAELQLAGFLDATSFSGSSAPATAPQQGAQTSSNNLSQLAVATPVAENQPPQPRAKLGRDRHGNPAWFIPDPDRAGKYLQVANHE